MVRLSDNRLKKTHEKAAVATTTAAAGAASSLAPKNSNDGSAKSVSASVRTHPTSNPPPDIPPPTSGASLAFTALQFLPTPLLVLGRNKTVVLANEAMGRLLGMEPPNQNVNRLAGAAVKEPSSPSITELLQGKDLSELGVNILQRDSPLWVSWELFLEALAKDMTGDEDGFANANSLISRAGATSPASDAPPLLRGHPVRDVALDVSLSNHGHKESDNHPRPIQIQAKMIVSIWVLDSERYFTLTFTSMASPLSPTAVDGSFFPKVSAPCVDPEPARLGSALLPMGAPASSDISTSPSVLDRMMRMKDAVLDAMEIPVFGMWHDGSMGFTNRAAQEISLSERNTYTFHRDELTRWYRLYSEDFERELEVDEHPLIKLVKTKKAISPGRFGMYSREGKKMVFDAHGDGIYDNDTGEFLGGLTWLRDVTEYQEKLVVQEETNELRFMTMCDCMPQLIWTTRPDGYHDYYSKRWYDFTGLTKEESLGMVTVWLPPLPLNNSGLTLSLVKGWKAPFHPEDMPLVIKEWMRCLETGQDYTVEYRCRRHDGVWRWMLGRALPLRDPRTGEIIKWYGTCTDIHDLVEARSEARRTRKQLQEVLQHSQITLWAIDCSNHITLLEGSIIWDLHNTAESYIGVDIYELFQDCPEFLHPIESILNGKDNLLYSETELNDGRWFRTKYVPILGKKGSAGQYDKNYVAGIIGVSLDTTEVHNASAELEARERENRVLAAAESAAKEASKLKSEFLASMSHEIRTPIAGVVGMAEIILDTNLDTEQREFAENIQRSANALLTVINDILDISKVESGRLDIEEVQFSLPLVVQDVTKMLSFDVERRKLAFECDADWGEAGENMTVIGDPGRIRQILTNLLTNSIKFTHEGFIKLYVEVVKEDDESIVVRFEVKDSGIGIDDDVQQKLFQPFTQADSSTARRFGGTGLGLTISKNLVDLMGGTIGLSSSLGAGTTAYFTIPFHRPQYQNGCLQPADISSLPDRLQSDVSVSCRSSDCGISTPPESPIDIALKRTRSSSHSTNLLKRITPGLATAAEIERNMEERKRTHVLVVEDNDINQQIAIRLIKKLNFSVSAVSNGLEALEFLKEAVPPSSTEPGSPLNSDASSSSSSTTTRPQRPDIILMDVQMPELDGYSATRIIRSGKLYEYPTEGNKEISLWRNPRNPKPAPKLPDGPSPSSEWLSGVPIVAMTASAIRGDREKCRDAGMDDYLAKPVKCTTLEKMLLKWCPGKHALRSNSYPISAPSSAPFAGSGDLSLTGSKKSPFTMAAIAHATGMDSNAPSGPGSMAVTEKGIVPNPDIKRVVVEPPSLSTVVSVNSTPKASDRHGRPVEDPFDSMYASDENSMHGINISVLKRQLQEEVMNSAAGGNGRERENLKEISHGKTTRGRTTESMPRIMHAASAPM
ncbi:uncharacterized protein H6S33_001403 [Morchella sextelata]|uniref:uncharacterized protein n=1 Tax=Morchella sextelata TaxID=1174677 RepID=UPI001D03645C|nr:uncharacterized protein H6S33_001403 [Morchella sextelata]KAH0609175.1 hypothetical protein H6S33_001403 [Morchella sextelata]